MCYIAYRLHYILLTGIAKIIEVCWRLPKRDGVKPLEQRWSEAKKTINGITGLEVRDKTAKVDPTSGHITEYRVGVKIAFGVEQ